MKTHDIGYKNLLSALAFKFIGKKWTLISVSTPFMLGWLLFFFINFIQKNIKNNIKNYLLPYHILYIKYTFIAPNHSYTITIFAICLLLLLYFILIQTLAEDISSILFETLVLESPLEAFPCSLHTFLWFSSILLDLISAP